MTRSSSLRSGIGLLACSVLALGGCATTRYLPVAPQRSTWQEAHAQLKSLMNLVPRISNVRVSEAGISYEVLVSDTHTIRRARPRRVVRRLLFSGITRITAAERAQLGEETWSVEVSSQETKHVLRGLPSAQEAQDLAAALARLADFAPDVRLSGADLPPVRERPAARRPAQRPGELDAELDRALEDEASEFAPPRAADGPLRSELLLDQPAGDEEGFRMRLWILPSAQYTRVSDVRTTQEGTLMELDGKALDAVTTTLSLELRLDVTPSVTVDGAVQRSTARGKTLATSNSLFAFGYVPLVMVAKAEVEVTVADLGVSYRWRLGLLELSARVGGRLVHARNEMEAVGVFFGQGGDSASQALPMIGGSVRALPFDDLPVWVTLGVDAGTLGDKAASARASLAVSAVWNDSLGVTLGYRVDWFSVGEKAKLFEPSAHASGTFHGPTAGLVVSF